MPLLVTTANSSVYSTSTTHRLFSLWLVVRSSTPGALPLVHSQTLRIYSGSPSGKVSFVSNSVTGEGVTVGAGVAVGGDGAGTDAMTVLWLGVAGGSDVAVSVGVGWSEGVETNVDVAVGRLTAILVGNGLDVEILVSVSSFSAVGSEAIPGVGVMVGAGV